MMLPLQGRATWYWWENDFITPDPLIDDFPDKIVVAVASSPQPNSFQDPSNPKIGQVEFQLKLEMSKPVWRLEYQSSESLVCGDDFVVKVQKLNWEKLASRAGKRNLRKLIKTTHIGIGPKNVFWAECPDARNVSPLHWKPKQKWGQRKKKKVLLLSSFLSISWDLESMAAFYSPCFVENHVGYSEEA